MSDKTTVLKQVRQALEREPRVNLHRNPLRIGFEQDAVVLEGEVADIAAKKLALEHAAAVEGIRGVVDRLHVAPSERRGDGAIADSLARLLLSQAELRNCTVRRRAKGRSETLHQASGTDTSGEIEFEVSDGVVVLEGSVISLTHKRLAGLLAWRTPGARDALNSLDVVPPEEDGDDEVLDALRLALETDPLVRPDSIRASCSNYVITLEGAVRSAAERARAELDAWSLFGVDRVVNRIEVLR